MEPTEKFNSEELEEVSQTEETKDDVPDISRRNFLKNIGMAAAGVAIASMLPLEKTEALASHQSPSVLDKELEPYRTQVEENRWMIEELTPLLSEDVLRKYNESAKSYIDPGVKLVAAEAGTGAAILSAGAAMLSTKEELAESMKKGAIAGAMIGGAVGGGVALVDDTGMSLHARREMHAFFKAHDFNVTINDVENEISRLRHANDSLKMDILAIRDKYGN